MGLNMHILSHQCNLVRWKKNLLSCYLNSWGWFVTCAKHIFFVDGKSSADMFMIMTWAAWAHEIKLFLLALFCLYVGLAKVRYRSQWLYWSKWTEGGIFCFFLSLDLNGTVMSSCITLSLWMEVHSTCVRAIIQQFIVPCLTNESVERLGESDLPIQSNSPKNGILLPL